MSLIYQLFLYTDTNIINPYLPHPLYVLVRTVSKISRYFYAVLSSFSLYLYFFIEISDSKTSVATRLSHSTGSYKLVDGTIIANNWNDLIDGTIQNPIDKDESGNQVSNGEVWTNTRSNGNPYYGLSFQDGQPNSSIW